MAERFAGLTPSLPDKDAAFFDSQGIIRPRTGQPGVTRNGGVGGNLGLKPAPRFTLQPLTAGDQGGRPTESAPPVSVIGPGNGPGGATVPQPTPTPAPAPQPAPAPVVPRPAAPPQTAPTVQGPPVSNVPKLGTMGNAATAAPGQAAPPVAGTPAGQPPAPAPAPAPAPQPAPAPGPPPNQVPPPGQNVAPPGGQTVPGQQNVPGQNVAPQPAAVPLTPPQPPTITFTKMPTTAELRQMQPGVQVMTPYGPIVPGADGKPELQFTPEGKVAYAQEQERMRQEYGPTPVAHLPGAPKPPVTPGKPFFNIFTGKWNTRFEGLF